MLSPEQIEQDIVQRGFDESLLKLLHAYRASIERAAYERAADKIEEIGKSQGNARDDALLLGISFTIRSLASPRTPDGGEG